MDCRICTNVNVESIDEACRDPDVTDWHIKAVHPDLTIRDISHHRRGCLKIENEIVEFTRSHSQIETTGNRDVVLERLEALVDTAQNLLDSADNTVIALKALKEVRDTLTSIAKIQKPAQPVDNSAELEEARALSRALRVVLPEYPEAGQYLAQTLVTLGFPDMGNQVMRFIQMTRT